MATVKSRIGTYRVERSYITRLIETVDRLFTVIDYQVRSLPSMNRPRNLTLFLSWGRRGIV